MGHWAYRYGQRLREGYRPDPIPPISCLASFMTVAGLGIIVISILLRVEIFAIVTLIVMSGVILTARGKKGALSPGGCSLGIGVPLLLIGLIVFLRRELVGTLVNIPQQAVVAAIIVATLLVAFGAFRRLMTVENSDQ